MSCLKSSWIVASLLIMSLLHVSLFTFSQVKKRQQQTVCRGHLAHLYTAYRLHSMDPNASRTSLKQLDDWPNKLLPFLASPEVLACPTAAQQASSEKYSYQLNAQAFIGNFFSQPQKWSTQRVVWLFDSISAGQPVVRQAPWQKVAYRHLAGANLLHSDGSVTEGWSGHTTVSWNSSSATGD